MKLKVNLENLTEEERENLMALVEKANKPKSKVWKPEEKEEYWYISDKGNSESSYFTKHPYHIKCFEIGNCFKTKEEAEFMIKKLKVIAELKRFAQENNNGETDWKGYKDKYYIIYNSQSNEISFNFCCDIKANDIYFTSSEIAQKAIETIGEDRLKKVLFRGGRIMEEYDYISQLIKGCESKKDMKKNSQIDRTTKIHI